MSSEKLTPYIDPAEQTAGDNAAPRTPGLTTVEAEAWHQAVEKFGPTSTDKDEIEATNRAMKELDIVRVASMAKAEQFYAGVAGIPLRALKGETKPGDPDHVPSLELKNQKF